MTRGILCKKLDPVTGEEIETSPEEQAEALADMRRAITTMGRIEFAPGALDDLKRMGMTPDEMLAIIAESCNAKH